LVWLRKHGNLDWSKPMIHAMPKRKPTRAEQFYVSDITYIKSRERTHYLSLITDAYSSKIVWHQLSDDMSIENVVKALKMAIKQRKSKKPLIHHSGRGLQYASSIYQKELKINAITPTDGHDCY